jgi:hypothetical protein
MVGILVGTGLSRRYLKLSRQRRCRTGRRQGNRARKNRATVRTTDSRAESVSGDMGPTLLCIALLVVWSSSLHADDQLPNAQHSAPPGLTLDALSATRDRPLFAPDRRKPVLPSVTPDHPASGAKEPLGAQKPQLTLVGIIAAPRGTIVLLRDRSTSQFLTLRSGETIGRWRIVATSNYSAKVSDGKEEYTLEMFAEP